ncbi:hypothetical protein G7Y79_00042g078620 [Physcia stellaris]|nr:hypothetical protein G7Y79_00042g078620 [Physcia stellaris]
MKTASLAGLIIGITIPSLTLFLFLPLVLKRCRARKKQPDENKDIEMNREVNTQPQWPFTVSSPTSSEASTPELINPTETKRCNQPDTVPSILSSRPNLGTLAQLQAQAHWTPDEVNGHDGSIRVNSINKEGLPRHQEQEQEGAENMDWRDVLDSREDLTHTEKLILASKHQLTSAPTAATSPLSYSSASSNYSSSFSSDKDSVHQPSTTQEKTTFPTTASPYHHPSPLAQHPTYPTTSPHASARSRRSHGFHYAERVLPLSSTLSPSPSRPIRRGEGGSFAQRMARSEASGGDGGQRVGGSMARRKMSGPERPHRERDGISRQRQTLAERRGQSLGSLGFEHMYRMPGKEWPIDGFRGE